MTTSIPRLTAAGFAALAITLAACGTPDPGVEAGRSDRTRAEAASDPATTQAEPVTSDADGGDDTTTTAPPTTAPPASDPATTDAPVETTPPDTVATERPPAPAASGPGSVSADDLDSVFLPTNPDLLGPASVLTGGKDVQTFLDEDMTFTGMVPAIEIAGAPLTLTSYIVRAPTFDESGATTAAVRFLARYRMAVEYDEDANVDEQAEALRDELRPIVEAANPGEVVTDTLGEAVLGNSIFGLRVGTEDNPTTLIEIDQHYVVIPRLVNDPLIAVDVTRIAEGNDIVPSELPGRDRFVDDALLEQVDLLLAVPAPVSAPSVALHRVVVLTPSAGAPTTNRSVSYDVELAADGFEAYVDSVRVVVEADEYEGVENFGKDRSFDHVEERVESEFTVTDEGNDRATVLVQGDVTAYP